jgi:hypothetical protein
MSQTILLSWPYLLALPSDTAAAIMELVSVGGLFSARFLGWYRNL